MARRLEHDQHKSDTISGERNYVISGDTNSTPSLFPIILATLHNHVNIVFFEAATVPIRKHRGQLRPRSCGESTAKHHPCHLGELTFWGVQWLQHATAEHLKSEEKIEENTTDN